MYRWRWPVFTGSCCLPNIFLQTYFLIFLPKILIKLEAKALHTNCIHGPEGVGQLRDSCSLQNNLTIFWKKISIALLSCFAPWYTRIAFLQMNWNIAMVQPKKKKSFSVFFFFFFARFKIGDRMKMLTFLTSGSFCCNPIFCYSLLTYVRKISLGIRWKRIHYCGYFSDNFCLR